MVRANLAVVLVGVLALFAIGEASGAPQKPLTVQNSPRICYSKENWGPAKDKYRPCVKITHLYEDGSFQFAVSDGDGVVRYTSGVGALDR